jgi:SM-20-related protein
LIWLSTRPVTPDISVAKGVDHRVEPGDDDCKWSQLMIYSRVLRTGQPRVEPGHDESERLDILDLDRLRAAPLVCDPFEFVVVEEFVRREALASILADFPEIPGHGSYPVDTLAYGAAFTRLVAALKGAALRRAVEEKFGLELADRPTMLTVRGRSDGKDGHIHTDSATKIITLLLYMNPVWDHADGRLRLLRGPRDIEDYAAEVVPLAGTMLAFRRSGRSFHGHQPHVGVRRSLQLNWVTDRAVLRRELSRHRWSARLKTLNPFARASRERQFIPDSATTSPTGDRNTRFLKQ